jgi:transglutaminase-like putative cysteine protease
VDTTARRVATVGAELGLLVLALSVTASFTRLFVGWDWLGTLAVVVAAAWAAAAAARRIGLGVPASVAVQSVVGVLVLSWRFAPDTLAVVLPTPATWQQLTDEVAASFGSFSELVAPVPATDGFLVVIAAALWVVAGFADTAAIRFTAPVQAAVPYVATMAAVGILARDSGRTTAGLVTAAGLALYAATQLALRASEQRWVAGRTARGARAVFASTLAVALVAVVGGALLGPRLPGSTEPVVDLRQLGRGDGPRTVVSPFVGIRSLLGERSDQVMFEVDADQPAYWRLTALERYDPEREIWVSRSTYQRTDGELPPALDADVPDTPLAQSFRIEGLATTWLPAAYAPASVTSEAELSYDSVSSSLILREGAGSGPLTYDVESRLPDLAELLAGGGEPLRTELDDEYLVDPGLAPEVTQLVASVTEGTTDTYTRMLALQNWFRSEFTYDDGVDYSDRDDALGAFLTDRRGFCQQFASAFALFARSLGVPSRVAVGFTPGDPVADDRDGGDGAVFVVRGRHAHAWPEVYFEGVGWVPFEPTPQRGNPQAQDYTGVSPQQASPPPQQAATTTSTTSPTTTASTAPTSVPDGLDATAEPEPEVAAASSDTGWLLAVALVLGAAVVVAVLVLLRRRAPGRDPESRAGRNAVIESAWHDAVRALALVELRPAPSETPVEFAGRVDRQLGAPMLARLARLETRRRFGLGTPSAQACQDAESAAQAIVQHMRTVTNVRQRVTARISR